MPISSSGHLALLQYIFDLRLPLALNVFSHTGSLAAILVYFSTDLRQLAANFTAGGEKRRQVIVLIKRLAAASLPILIAGVFLEAMVARAFTNLIWVGGGFLVTAVFLMSPRWIKFSKQSFFTIGLGQVLALLPGVSRSGTTISLGRVLGLEKKAAFRFSFFLGMIAILAATVYQLPQSVGFTSRQWVQAGLMAGSAFVSGLLSLRLLDMLLENEKMWWFSFYCLIMAVVCFVLF